MDDLRELFVNPGSEYRGKPFWAWNGKLEAGELRRQIRVMKRMGLGGFFMHSRVGLATPYLSDEWFEMVDACIDEAGKHGMEAWLYDEDRWPSGAAGGLVTRDPRHRQRMLHMVVCEPQQSLLGYEPLALFSAVIEGHVAREVRPLQLDEWGRTEFPGGTRVLAFFLRAAEPDTWYNDHTYLDTMSHEAVRKFIEVTHEAYRAHCGRSLGNVVPGVFTDEPNHGTVFGTGNVEGRRSIHIPWTPELPEHFRERYGYDILDYLPHLFFNVDGCEVSPHRWHYHDCVTFLFVDAFSRQIGEWCERNNMLSTGHVLSERELVSQVRVGGAAMPFYEFMQAPGIDQLTEHLDEYSTAKQCSSVLHQTGRRWMLSELYGCTGWDWPFEGHKAVGDWQAVLGVNLRCQHLSWYTMSGQAKRDYPASISFQSPWSQHYPKVEDYYARVNAVMSRGKAVQRLLVVHPVESVWARAAMSWDEDEAVARLERQFDDLILLLLDGHVDFDFGDEQMMGRLAAVRKEPAARFAVGRASYDVVLVPPVDTIRSGTLALLREFRDAGGTVAFCEPVPRHVDAEPSDEAAELAASCTVVPFEQDAVLSAVAPARVVSISDADGREKAGVFYLLHYERDEFRMFICNRDRRNGTGPLTITVKAEGNVQLWDAESGARFAVQAEATEDGLRFRAELPATGSRLFVITPVAEDLPPVQKLGETRAVELPADAWRAELTESNVFVLDTVEYMVDGGDWAGPTEILRADAEMRKAIGLPLRGGRMVQPWARKKQDGPTGQVALMFRFHVEEPPSGPITLAVENPDRFKISLNGHAVLADSDCGWWVDPAIRMLPLDEAPLVKGENVLILAGTMDGDTNVEACFLLGDFSVGVDGARARMAGGRPAVGFGDWTKQGLPFYCGSVVFRASVKPHLAEGERLFVEVPQFAGACVRVLVDRNEAGIIGWEPHEVEITELAAGKEEIGLAVEIVAHRRNAFGPLHTAVARPHFVGPHTFTTDGKDWQDAYSLVPVGCLVAPRLSVRRPE